MVSRLNCGTLLTRAICSVLLAASGIGLLACSVEAPASNTPIPTIGPTSTPDPILGLEIEGATTIEDLRFLTTPTEWSCLQTLGAESGLTSTALSVNNPLDLMSAFRECLEPSSLPDLLIASLHAASGGLSAESIRCLRGTLVGTNPLATGAAQTENDAAGLAGLLGLTLCLSETESQQIDLTGGLDSQESVSLGQFRCAIQQVDLVQILSGSSQLTSETFLDNEFVEAFAKCGVDIVSVVENS